MRKKELILIKLGGSIVTNKMKEFIARPRTIKRLGREMQSTLSRHDVIIAHGSGSFGHTVASRYKTQSGLVDSESIKGLALVADAAIQINRIVVQALLSVGLPVVSFAPASFLTTKNGNIKELFVDPIKQALAIGIVPVTYGDITFDAAPKRFCINSGEKTLTAIAKKLKSTYSSVRIIYCGDTDGVYDGNNNTILSITTRTFSEVSQAITGSKATDVTGGMLHKVQESLLLAKKCTISTQIINGLKEKNLQNALEGKPVISTTISA